MIAIISDVHGNYEALKAVLQEIDKMQIRNIYCLGDITGYYSQVNECCDELRRRNVECVMGNHDWYLVSGNPCERSQSVNDCIAFQRKKITTDNLQWLEKIPVIMKKHGIAMVHGGWANPIDEYLTPQEKYFENIEGKFFASGHTHVQKVCKWKDKTYCNPGSVGQPRDGDARAAFATFDGNNFYLHRIRYDIQRVGELMEEAGFNPYYYGCLRDGASKLHR